MMYVARIAAALLLALAIAAAPERAWLAGQHAMAPCPTGHGDHSGHAASPAESGHSHARRLPDLACAAWCAAQCASVFAQAPGAGTPGATSYAQTHVSRDDAFDAGINPGPDPPPPRRLA